MREHISINTLDLALKYNKFRYGIRLFNLQTQQKEEASYPAFLLLHILVLDILST